MTDRIPLDILFGNPERAAPRLSPDGTRLAWLAPLKGVLNVWIGHPDGTDARAITADTDRGIRSYMWTHDGRSILYVQDKGGDENWRLYKVDATSGEVADLTPFDEVQVQLVAHEKHRPHDVLLAMNKEDARLHDVYHLDLRTNALRLVEKNPGDVVEWLADYDLDIRAAVASTPDGGSELRVRTAAGGPWETVVRWSPEDALTSRPVAFTRDGMSLYLLDSRGANALRLVRLDLAGAHVVVLAEDPRYDAADAMIHPDTRVAEMVAFARARTEWTVLDPSVADDIAAIRRLNPGDFGVEDRTDDDRHWIVVFIEDARPASYFLFDRDTRRGTFLFHTRPALAEYRLATMEPVSLTSRDGFTIEGYLTRPPDAPAGPLPMVLNVHGGPWHRDVWGYNPEAQWLANRGYACLQVNYRGSTGYGKRFLNAGNKEWGRKMHDDLVDAVRWAVDQQIADPKRVAIYGGSYGGYAALVGATFTPDLFACAVDIVGPSNLLSFINTIPPYWSTFLAMMHDRVGNPETEADFLRSRSPLTFVDRIRIPMLIAQGANDPRVKQAESEQIVAAMEAKHIPHEYMLFPDEGHGFAKPENRLKFYRAAEDFLARHLAPAA